MNTDIKLAQPIGLDLEPRGFVYRLWAEDGTCIYVGQHVGYHPGTRIAQHHRKTWWKQVARVDYIAVSQGEQHELERQEIARLKPTENKLLPLSRIPDDAHGRPATYNNKHCRCDQCREAMRVYREQQRRAAVKDLDQDKVADLRLRYRIADLEMEQFKIKKRLADLDRGEDDLDVFDAIRSPLLDSDDE